MNIISKNSTKIPSGANNLSFEISHYVEIVKSKHCTLRLESKIIT